MPETETVTDAVDVVITTLNAAHKFRECLDAVCREIPAGRIIVVDGGSTDGTQEIARSFARVDLHVRADLVRGDSLTFAFGLVKTEWFLQIDSDVILRPGWLEKARAWCDKADAIELGTANMFELPTPVPEEVAHPDYQRQRAYLFNVLLRRDAVKQVKLDMPWCSYEDEWLRRQVVEHGFRWVRTGIVHSEHHSNPVRYGRKGPLMTFIRTSPPPDWFYESIGFVEGATNPSRRHGLFIAWHNMRAAYAPLRAAWRACPGNPVRVFLCTWRGFMRGVARWRGASGHG